MSTGTSRRGFLQSAGGLATWSALGGGLLPGLAQAASVGVRRNVGNMTAADPVLLTYRQAIKAMKALPASDPRSWSYQAAIHGTMTTPVKTAWNTCEHSSTFFWSWHRMYLYWFERICRHLAGDCGDPCWRLPYWDWASPTQRHLPAPFRDTASELYESNRFTGMNAGTDHLQAGIVDLSGCWPMPDFYGASGAFSGPHGGVHVSIGGYMGMVPTAAQDPIFYLHHANVDRQWNLWLAQGSRSDPLSDSTWKTQQFTFFDEHGVEIHMNSCQVIRAAEQLDYYYEGEPEQVPQYCERHRFPWTWELATLKEFPLALRLDARTRNADLPLADVRARLKAFKQSDEQLLLLELDDIVADRPSDIVWEVHLGATGKAELADGSPSFLGIVALFGEGLRDMKHGDHEFKPARFVFPIRGELLKRVMKAPERMRLTLVPRGVGGEGEKAVPRTEAKTELGRARLSIQTRRPAPAEQ